MVKRLTYGGNHRNKEKMKIRGGDGGKKKGEGGGVTVWLSVFFSPCLLENNVINCEKHIHSGIFI